MASTATMTDQGDNSQFRDAGIQLREYLVGQLKEDNFVLFFQPIMPAAAGSSEVPFREILVRYKEEEKDLIPPGSFLPVLEEQGLLPLLDRWVVGRLLTWGRKHQQAGHQMPHCSVNLSIDTIRRDEAFGDYVLRGLQKMGISPASITFEIMTTDALANRAALARLIPPLRAAGVSFAFSWFAGEESALELAPTLGISYIKIDGSLAARIGIDPKEKAKLGALVQRCRKLGMRTVCMLVETRETYEHLRTIHVDYVQGFGVAKPRALDA